MFERLFQKHEAGEQEVIVLIRQCIGAARRGGDTGGLWNMTATTLGMVFCDTGKVCIQEGRLQWSVTEKERNGKKGWGRFKPGQICRLTVRRLPDASAPEHTAPEQLNSWAVVKVLKRSVPCPPLRAVWEEYKKPVRIADEVLGPLDLNRDLEQLEGEVLWNGEKVLLALEVDLNDQRTWGAAGRIARALVAERERWDKSLREFAAKELTALANEWHEDDGENAGPITEEAFARRIVLSELSITYKGDFTACFEDDDMFWGHTVEVYGTLEDGAESADISG